MQDSAELLVSLRWGHASPTGGACHGAGPMPFLGEAHAGFQGGREEDDTSIAEGAVLYRKKFALGNHGYLRCYQKWLRNRKILLYIILSLGC